MWVVDCACSTDECKRSLLDPNITRHCYSPGNSSTYQRIGKEVQVGLFSRGYLGSDTIVFGDLTVPNQTFVVVNELGTYEGIFPKDGVMGLDFPKASKDGIMPPLWHILKQLDQQLFSVFLERLTIGQKTLTTGKPLRAISDTGSAWIGFKDDRVLGGFAQQIGAGYDFDSDAYIVECGKKLPDAVFTIGGKDYRIPSKEYVTLPEDVHLGKNKCLVAVLDSSTSASDPFDDIAQFDVSLGAPFIRTYCNVYDIGQKRVGFALSKQ